MNEYIPNKTEKKIYILYGVVKRFFIPILCLKFDYKLQSKKMYNCFDIAKKFLELSKSEGQIMTPMKLLKLTYIAHGYYLAFTEKPLFSNNVEAWKYGPVIPELYHIVKRVNFSGNDFSFIEMYSTNKISKVDGRFLSSVWDAYKKFDGGQLSSKTHEEETPWAKTYNGHFSTKIDNELIKQYYKTKINA